MFAAGKTNAVSGVTYVDDVFSTWLYTGTGSTQTITNGIDLAGKGGLVWQKVRTPTFSNTIEGHIICDSARGTSNTLLTNTTSAQNVDIGAIGNSFNSSGFNSIGYGSSYTGIVSWTFRKQAKFFDVVTYTGNGANRTISHNLGSVPGCIIVKRTDAAAAWQVYHRSLANTDYLVLNTTAASATGTTRWNSTTATATNFSLGTDTTVNANTGTYVAYLFSHDTASDGLIQCGVNTAGGNNLINLGWEPQFVLFKRTDIAEDWRIIDSMRGFTVDQNSPHLIPNTSGAEVASNWALIRNTGFTINAGAGNYIYVAIRRPNKPPTSGTQVYNAIARTGTGAAATVTGVGFAPDLYLASRRDAGNAAYFDRLRGYGGLTSTSTSAEISQASLGGDELLTYEMNGVSLGSSATSAWLNPSGINIINWFFRRAPGVFDVVCYTGTGSATTVAHSLGVVPELMIVKRRGTTGAWPVYSAAISNTEYLVLNTTAAKATGTTYWNSTTPTSSVFSLGTAADVNASTASNTYVAYLFASAAGVSKVGSYTGTGTTLQVNCGFTGGARFVLIKRTDSTGDWYVWDSARGIVAGNDPYLLLNSTAAEVTNTDYVDTYSAGFEISSTAPAAINANGGSFIYLAIA